MSITANYPNLRPSFLADFGNTQQVDPRITFTRSSTATYYDGHTNALAEQNMFVQSNNFTTTWGNTNITPAQTATDPFGNANTAWVLNEGTNTGVHGVSQAPSSIQNQTGSTYTLSVYAQNVTGQYLQLSFWSALPGYAATVIFDLSTGVITSQIGGYPIVNATITLVSGTWYRCTLSATIGVSTYIGAFTTYIAMSNSSTYTPSSLGYLNSYTGTSRTINIYGAQLEQRAFANVYQPTTTAFISNFIPQLLTAQPNVPRFAIDPSTSVCTGLLRELQNTNLQIYSQDFTNSAYRKTSLTALTAQNIAPDGTQTANLLTGGGGATVGFDIYPTDYGSSLNAVQTFSIYAKAPTSNAVATIQLNLGNTSYATFNLTTGAITGLTASTTAIATPIGNNWWRFSVTATKTNIYNYWAVYLPTTSTASVYLWGCQLENNNYASSYIQTVQAQVTRAQEDAYIQDGNLNAWYAQSQGTLYAEAILFASASTNGLITIDNTTNYSTVGVIRGGTFLANTLYKSAVSYNSSGQLAYAGTTPTNVQATNQVQANRLVVGVGNLYYSFSVVVKKIAYYPQPFTTSQLQALTGS